jgi:DNA-binding NtrC family response regulator
MERREFDVVMLDLRMPGMDGMTTLKAIKQRWPDCEVVVITGYPSVDTAKEALRLGAYNYLAKPVSPDDVMDAATGAMMHRQWGLRQERIDSCRQAA